MYAFMVVFKEGKRLSKLPFGSRSVSHAVRTVTGRNVGPTFIQTGPGDAEIRTEQPIADDEKELIAQKLGGTLKPSRESK